MTGRHVVQRPSLRRRFLSAWVGDDPNPEPATPARVSGPVCTGGVFCHVPGHVVYRDQGGGYQAVHIGSGTPNLKVLRQGER
jgi:hypothetical protein